MLTKKKPQNYILNLELVWAIVWSILLCFEYILLVSKSSYTFFNIDRPGLLIFQYSLQVIIIIASFLSWIVLILSRFIFSQKSDTELDLVTDATRVLFPFLNLIYYVLASIDNLDFKLNFGYLWLILPWLLWIPLVLDISSEVKKELSWVKLRH